MKTYVTILLLMLCTTHCFGQRLSVAGNDSIKLHASYCAQCFDVLEAYESLLANQKAQTIEMGLAYEESKIQAELLKKKIKKVQKPSFWQKAWETIKIIAVGVGAFLLGNSF